MQGLITFSSLGSADPTLNMTNVLELNSYIATQQPDVIVLNETWLKDSIQNSELFPNRNYKIFRLDRSPVSHPPHTTDPKKFRSNGGGVMIAINSSLDKNVKQLKLKSMPKFCLLP